MLSKDEASLIYQELKKAIPWKKVSKGIYSKAIKYLKESSCRIETNTFITSDTYHSFIFYWYPIEGYNKEVREVSIVISSDGTKFFCNCDGYKKNGICSHVLATYIYAKQLSYNLIE